MVVQIHTFVFRFSVQVCISYIDQKVYEWYFSVYFRSEFDSGIYLI